jgi:hypothetical protein
MKASGKTLARVMATGSFVASLMAVAMLKPFVIRLKPRRRDLSQRCQFIVS